MPITDFENAGSLPYDTDIPGREYYFLIAIKNFIPSFHHYVFIADAEIPKNPVVALEQNAMKVTRQEAVKQVKQMMNLIDDISSTTIKNSVSGEEFKTKTKGVQILMTK